jgi:hypothetical protein
MTTGPDNGAEVMLSIIVPVFNFGPYLRQRLDSILKQIFAHPYETILMSSCNWRSGRSAATWPGTELADTGLSTYRSPHMSYRP